MVEVQAEIAANVWQVPAEEGQMIAEGDTIAILESMKMEIPVEAPVSGTITEIRVKPEDQVNEGDIIALIDDACRTRRDPLRASGRRGLAPHRPPRAPQRARHRHGPPPHRRHTRGAQRPCAGT